MKHSMFAVLTAGIGLLTLTPGLHAQDAEAAVEASDVQVVEAMFIRAEASPCRPRRASAWRWTT